MPRQSEHHRAGPHSHRQRRRALQGQHPRPGGEQERAARRGQLHVVPWQPRHPAAHGPGEPRLSREHPGHMRQLPRRHQDGVRRRRPRIGAGQGQHPGTGVRRLPHRAPDPARGRDVLAAGRHSRVRDVPRRQDQDVSRHVPRTSDIAGLRAGRDVLGLPRSRTRSIRNPTRARPSPTATCSKRAGPAIPRRPRSSPSTTRTPTRRTQHATRCSTTPPSS